MKSEIVDLFQAVTQGLYPIVVVFLGEADDQLLYRLRGTVVSRDMMFLPTYDETIHSEASVPSKPLVDSLTGDRKLSGDLFHGRPL